MLRTSEAAEIDDVSCAHFRSARRPNSVLCVQVHKVPETITRAERLPLLLQTIYDPVSIPRTGANVPCTSREFPSCHRNKYSESVHRPELKNSQPPRLPVLPKHPGIPTVVSLPAAGLDGY